MFSLQMTENLINDLLDLAKMDHNSLKFDMSYFNLVSTIYQTLDMVVLSSKELGIELEAVIDKQENLSLLTNIYGDKRRYI